MMHSAHSGHDETTRATSARWSEHGKRPGQPGRFALVVDFHAVAPQHEAIHERLLEWGRAQHNGRGTATSPMFEGFESSHNAKAQMDAPRMPVDVARVSLINEHIARMGERLRKAVHWHYSMNKSPAYGMQYIGCSKPELASLVVDARQILTLSLQRVGVVV